MNLEDLNNIDTQDLAAVKKAQMWLRSLGYYAGPIDGKWGGATTAAIAAMRDSETARQNTQLEQQRLKTQQTQAENDPTGQLTRFGTEVGPYAVGATSGYLGSRYLRNRFAAADAAQQNAVSRLAANPNLHPDAAAAELDRLNRTRGFRQGAQFLAPAAAYGGAYLTNNVAQQFPEDSSARKYINLAATGENAAGTVLAGKQLINMVGDWTSPNDPEDIAAIRSRAMPPPETPPSASPSAPPELRPNGERAIAAARAGGATNIRTKAAAIDWLQTPGNVTRANRAAVVAELGAGAERNLPAALSRIKMPGVSSLLVPFAAGGLAYDAATSDAEAAGATSNEARKQGLLAGGVATGTTGAVQYGLSKLPGVSRFLAPAAPAINAISDYGQEDTTPLTRGLGTTEADIWNVYDRYRERQPGNPPMSGLRTPVAGITSGGNANFQAALDRVLAAIQEHNDSATPPPGRNPAIAYEAGQ